MESADNTQNNTNSDSSEKKDELYKSQTAQMRTFSSDLVEQIRKHQGSVMKIAIMEQEKKRIEDEAKNNNPRKNSIFFVSGVVVIITALAIGIGVYIHIKNSQIVPVQSNQVPVSIIKSESFVVVNVSAESAGDTLKSISNEIKNSNVPIGMIENIYAVSGKTGSEIRLSATDFLKQINVNAPDNFLRNLSPDYMLGVYSYNQSNFFMVLRGTQHDQMLSGMLEWEPFMLSDLAPLFDIDISGANSYLTNTSMSEMLIQNHDVRAVLDRNQQPVLFYSFLDPNTVVITSDADTLNEAVTRLNK